MFKRSVIGLLVLLGATWSLATATANRPLSPAYQAVMAARASMVRDARASLERRGRDITCGTASAWRAVGTPEQAAGVLLGHADARGWTVVAHGPLAWGYGLLFDSDPLEPRAIGFGGILEFDGAFLVFLVSCLVR